MIENKNTEIILCSNIHIDKNYDNVLDVSKETLVGYLRNHSEYSADDFTIVPRYRNKILVKCPYATALKCNYMTFTNPDYDDEYVFAFIDTVDYVSDESVQINFTLDVWHTNHDKFNINKVFVEREHVSDDTFGKHTIPEQLETGEYTIKSETDSSDLTLTCPVVGATVNPDDQNEFGNYLGNRYEALGYYIFKGLSATSYNVADQVMAIGSYLEEMASNSKSNAIVSIFMAPRKLAGWTVEGEWQSPSLGSGYTWRNADAYYTSSTEPITFTDLTVTRPTTFGSYTPKNNKCYCYPYQYINLTNNNGGNGLYHYEDFSNNTPTFDISGVLCPSCSIHASPKNYKNQTVAYNDGLQGAKYPICSWQNDVYTNWLTQQGINIALDTTKNIASIVGGVATGNVAGVVGGFTGIANQMSNIYQHSLIPPQAEGNVNGGDVCTSKNKLTFTLQTIQVREEMIRIIDSYFSRFGYRVNEIKTPTLYNRTQFDFIKVGGTDNLISGKIPSRDLDEINAICRRGVTIFHNITNFGDYTVSNPIVS